jgi:hypothetical protein
MRLNQAHRAGAAVHPAARQCQAARYRKLPSPAFTPE